MSYLSQRPEPLIDVPRGRASRPIILAVIFVVVVIILVIVFLILTSPKSSTIVKCTSNANCSSLQPFCQITTGTCVGCLTSSDCPSGETCTTGNTCSVTKCTGNGDCPASAPKCDTTKGVCFQCIGASDCPIVGSTCSAEGVCVAPCGSFPGPVTNLQVTGNMGTQIVSWTPPVAMAGQAVANYIVTQSSGACSAVIGATTATQTVPVGTNSVTFTMVAPGTNTCYRVQSSNACGNTPLSSAPTSTGITCGTQPTAFPDSLENYMIDPSCTHSYSSQFMSSQFCPCTCGSNCVGLDSSCPSDCTGPFCPSGSSSTTCQVNLSWLGPYPGADKLIIFTRQNVTNIQASITIEDGEATLPFNMDQNGILPGTKSWYQQCSRTSLLTQTYVSSATEAVLVMPTGTQGFITVPAHAEIQWQLVSGADEYAILIFSPGLSYGTIVPYSPSIVNPMTGNGMYNFVSTAFSTPGAAVHVYAYSTCNKSDPSPGSSVSS
jgi:Cys-rich repeat protein